MVDLFRSSIAESYDRWSRRRSLCSRALSWPTRLLEDEELFSTNAQPRAMATWIGTRQLIEKRTCGAGSDFSDSASARSHGTRHRGFSRLFIHVACRRHSLLRWSW